MSAPEICAMCGLGIVDEFPSRDSDGDPCHFQCLMDDMDSVGMDRDMGDSS